MLALPIVSSRPSSRIMKNAAHHSTKEQPSMSQLQCAPSASATERPRALRAQIAKATANADASAARSAAPPVLERRSTAVAVEPSAHAAQATPEMSTSHGTTAQSAASQTEGRFFERLIMSNVPQPGHDQGRQRERRASLDARSRLLAHEPVSSARLRSTVALCIGLAACTASTAPPECPTSPIRPEPERVEVTGADDSVDAIEARLVEAINARDAAAVVALFGPAMRQALPEAEVQQLISSLTAQNGRLLRARQERSKHEARRARYRVEAERGELQMLLTVNEGLIQGLWFSPVAPPDPPIARSELPLRLPILGRWVVAWGGGHAEVNPHVDHPSQRRAADLWQVGSDGKRYEGDGKLASDYHAYGRDVLAAADGTVITVVDGVPDNPPGQMDAALVTGNFVAIQHADQLFSLYAHLQPGSPRVRPGQRVRAGEVLGKCGNSGNSSEPHLHFQLQDAASFSHSWGIEAVFPNVKVTRAGTTNVLPEYTFLAGDVIEAPKAGAGSERRPADIRTSAPLAPSPQ
jgi:murein DD-endopeptidase MepM/ murein hydrolase activator NlpD